MKPRPADPCQARCIMPFRRHEMLDDATIESAIRQAHRTHRDARQQGRDHGSDAVRTGAAVTAWRIEGVKRVRNEIHVRP